MEILKLITLGYVLVLVLVLAVLLIRLGASLTRVGSRLAEIAAALETVAGQTVPIETLMPDLREKLQKVADLSQRLSQGFRRAA